MARRLHTRVGDHIHRIARTDPERAAEMRAGADGNDEYAREVRGHFDSDEPDDDDYDGREEEPEEDEEMSAEERAERQAEYDDRNPPPRENPGG
jgi:hypothetical protein